MIIAIDGPSGTGKSTVAKRVANQLGLAYCDTGAFFRSYAYGIIANNIDITDIQRLTSFLNDNLIHVDTEGQTKQYSLGGVDVTSFIRQRDVTLMASKIAVIPIVREHVVVLQHAFAEEQDAVFEGRDMGSVVFPNAEVKVFLTASPRVRAERRYKEQQAPMSLEEVERDIAERDQRDETRAISPLKPAPDATIIDTSELTIDEVVARVIELYHARVTSA